MIKDKLGQEILKGDFIVYGHNLGRCAGLRIGKVLKIDEKGRITVRGIDDDWKHRPPQLCSRAGVLLYPNRVIVLPCHMLDDERYKLLYSIRGDSNEV